MIRGAWRLEHRQEDSSTQEYRALAHLAKVPVQPEVLVLEGLAKVFQITMAQDAVAGSGLYQLSARRAFPMLGGISGCPFLGVFWLVFSEGLQSSWKPLCLKLPILETLFLFISIWLISIYDLCTIPSCGSLAFGMWACPSLPGRKQLLPAQCREVALACSEGNLVNFFSRAKTWLMVE